MLTQIKKCFSCGREMTLFGFVCTLHRNNNFEIFGAELLEKIWENPIFVLNCCTCYNIDGLLNNVH